MNNLKAKFKILISFIFIQIMNVFTVKAQYVSLFAGSGMGAYLDTLKNYARFYYPSGIAVDKQGNVFVADMYNNMIRKINTSGYVTTFAGNLNAGNLNDTGKAATFFDPTNIAIGNFGDIYVTDMGNNLIRKISTAGVVTTLAGSGTLGSINGQGINASFNYPYGIAVDKNENVYVSEEFGNTIRKIDSFGNVTTYAGTGIAGNTDGNALNASFFMPAGICLDNKGNLFIADYENIKIRKVSTTGIVSTIAGNGTSDYINGIGKDAAFNQPISIAVDTSGNLYITDFGNNVIRKIDNNNEVTTYTGMNPIPNFADNTDGYGTNAIIILPSGITIDNKGNLFITQANSNIIRKIKSIPLSIPTITLQNTQSTFYPNPATNTTSIDLYTNSSTPATIKVYNTLGKLVYETKFTTQANKTTYTLPTNQLASGVYMVSIVMEGEVMNKKLKIE